MMPSVWTMRQALLCLIGSVFATLCVTFGGYSLWSKYHQNKILNEKYRVVSIVQTGPEKEALKTPYLAELLGTSADQAVSLYSIDCREAAKKLLSSPLTKSASVKRIPPGTIYIDYELRKP